jgi:hypothetical protein
MDLFFTTGLLMHGGEEIMMMEFTVEVQRTSELISSEPGALGAPSWTAVTPRNPREEGKRGGGGRTHR